MNPCTAAASGVTLAAQVFLHVAQRRLQRFTDPQGHRGGQDVDDQQVQQSRDHGAVFVIALGVVGRQVDVPGAGQG